MVKRAKAKNVRARKALLYIFTLLFSALYIYFGNAYAQTGMVAVAEQQTPSVRARIVEISDYVEEENASAYEEQVVVYKTYFRAELLQGEQRGELVDCLQTVYSNFYPRQELVEQGDKLLIYESAGGETPWLMLEYYRTDALLILGALFVLAVILFGRFKGLNTIISLAFTCLAVFSVFVPAILSGKNIYIWTVITCLYIIVMTMLLINGADRKSFVAGAGCFAGVAAAALITLIMDKFLMLTGMIDDDTLYLLTLNVENPIDLRGVIFAMIAVGALGAIMDVAMDIASSLREIHFNSPQLAGRGLIRSGFNIGRDVMGTMANTLVLAYIGSSLCVTLLLVVYNPSLQELFNMEMIIVEVLQALAGSFGILLTIPLTSMIGAAVYTRS
ncbi:MAG: YibE/F family protein [Bacillota bacterium]|nr:YibE/F family protein [Bacillota bacterium]